MPENKTLEKLPPIESGAVLQVSDANGTMKYVTRFVGVDSDVIISRLPSISQLKKSEMGSAELIYRDTFFKKRKLVMRLISNGHVYAFETDVMDLFVQGSRLLMSTYPKLVQGRMLRKEPRYPCTLPAKITVGETNLSGVMINFSQSGGLCQLTEEIDQVTLLQAKDDDLDVSLSLQLPFDDEPAQLKGKLMAVLANEKQLGLSFAEGKELIQRYITSLKLDSISEYF
ncbi:PilZ domain-containing protein [Amphritea sp. HPY]|uniref:PilZ domain-containing protein n=1 Tax=Amphritea sp. HPY TaxID=3421652 RepID=UPI003D7EC362